MYLFICSFIYSSIAVLFHGHLVQVICSKAEVQIYYCVQWLLFENLELDI